MVLKLKLPVINVRQNCVILNVNSELLSKIVEKVKVREEKPRFYGISTYTLKNLVKRLFSIGVFGMIAFGTTILNNKCLDSEILISLNRDQKGQVFLDVQPLIYFLRTMQFTEKVFINEVIFQLEGFRISTELVESFFVRLIVAEDREIDLTSLNILQMNDLC